MGSFQTFSSCTRTLRCLSLTQLFYSSTAVAYPRTNETAVYAPKRRVGVQPFEHALCAVQLHHALVLCSSGLSSDARRRLEASAAALSGVCSPDLTDQTTHLVAESVTPRSRKLACARRLGLPVVRPSWIHDSAARGALLPLAEGLLSPLAGVVLCVSGISFRADEREWVEAAVENAGGRFSRVLDASTTHHMTSGGHDGGAKDEALLAFGRRVRDAPTPMW